MSLDQLLGLHARLERELASAFSAQPWPGARIERLADELAATEVEIAGLQPASAARGNEPVLEATLSSR